MRMSWEEFLEDASNFISCQVNEMDWQLVGDVNVPGLAYLIHVSSITPGTWKEQQLNNREAELRFEELRSYALLEDPHEVTPSTSERKWLKDVHILWSLSYGVPVLFFNVWKSGVRGCQPMSVEEARRYALLNDRFDFTELSQAMHPILSAPYMFFHPCKSLEILNLFPTSKNRLVSWLSCVNSSTLDLPIPLSCISLT